MHMPFERLRRCPRGAAAAVHGRWRAEDLGASKRIKPKLDKTSAKCYYNHGFIDMALQLVQGLFFCPEYC